MLGEHLFNITLTTNFLIINPKVLENIIWFAHNQYSKHMNWDGKVQQITSFPTNTSEWIEIINQRIRRREVSTENSPLASFKRISDRKTILRIAEIRRQSLTFRNNLHCEVKYHHCQLQRHLRPKFQAR